MEGNEHKALVLQLCAPEARGCSWQHLTWGSRSVRWCLGGGDGRATEEIASVDDTAGSPYTPTLLLRNSVSQKPSNQGVGGRGGEELTL